MTSERPAHRIIAGVDIEPVIAEQARLAAQVRGIWDGVAPRVVVGVDVAGGGRTPMMRAAAVALTWPTLEVQHVTVEEGEPSFPYIPGLLAVREAPVILAALRRLGQRGDLLMVDGQGIAHPRRLGIAAYLGVTLDMPAIGVAKSRLVGKHDEPGPNVGAWEPLVERGELIGAALRTRAGSKPLIVSIGHRVDLETAIRFVLAATRGYRLPEPTRLADRASKGHPIG